MYDMQIKERLNHTEAQQLEIRIGHFRQAITLLFALTVLNVILTGCMLVIWVFGVR